MRKGINILITCTLLMTMAAGCGAKAGNKAAAAATEKQDHKEITGKLDKVFTDFYGPDTFSGYVFVSKKGEILLDKAYGKADFEKGTEITKQTKFDLASLTKQFTAFAIMQLEDKKLLDLNDKVDKYLPTFPRGSEITIHQLLTHTSGLPANSLEFDIRKFRPSYKGFGSEGKDEKVNYAFNPGTDFLYSNTGYILLGFIVEKVSGKALDAYLDENIFKPLDMKNTGFKNGQGELNGLAVGYDTPNKEKSEKPWTLTNIGPVVGSSALCSTTEDLIKWEKSLTDQKLISKVSYEKIYTPDKKNYGLGWYIFKDAEGKRSYEHFGEASGYRSYILRKVDEDTRVIIVSNYQNTPIEDMVGLVKDYIK